MNINFEIKDQVVEIGLAIKLKRLGAKQDSYFVWYKGELAPKKDVPENADDNDVFAAFTCQELGWKLPKCAKCGDFKIFLGMDKSGVGNEMEIWYEKSDSTTWKEDCYMGTHNEVYNRGFLFATLLESKVVFEDGTPLG